MITVELTPLERDVTGSEELVAWRGFADRVRTLIGQVRSLVDAGQLPTDDLIADVDGLTDELGAAVTVLVERTLAPKPVAVTVPIQRFDLSGRAMSETPSTPVLSGVTGWRGGPVTAPRKGRPLRPSTDIDWTVYPVRKCRAENHCCRACGERIKYGERFYDGAHNTRRAHARCVQSQRPC